MKIKIDLGKVRAACDRVSPWAGKVLGIVAVTALAKAIGVNPPNMSSAWDSTPKTTKTNQNTIYIPNTPTGSAIAEIYYIAKETYSNAQISNHAKQIYDLAKDPNVDDETAKFAMKVLGLISKMTYSSHTQEMISNYISEIATIKRNKKGE